MCGVTAIWDINSIDRDKRERIVKMTNALAHRGPNSKGAYVSPTCALGHARLSIIDIASGQQPFSIAGYTMVFNGEIYNYIELKDQLTARGHVFMTASDTEVALRCYMEYGADCFAKFNGEWAIIIYDKVRTRLIVARDRYGIRPLFTTQDHHGVAYFSSEIKSFDYIEGFSRQYDQQALIEHGMLWNTIGETTVYKGVQSLSAGHYRVYENSDHFTDHLYYEIGESLGMRPEPSFSDASELTRSLLKDAIRLRLRTEVPYGVYLSGGIDSCIIAGLVKELAPSGFSTYSVAFDNKSFDESSYQSLMVDRLQSHHHQVVIDNSAIEDNLQRVVRHVERPLFRTAPVPMYHLARAAASDGIKVVLTGEAADEIFCGYDTFKEAKLLEFWGKDIASEIRPHLIKRLYPHLAHYGSGKQYGMMKMYYQGMVKKVDPLFGAMAIRMHNNEAVLGLMNGDFIGGYSLDATREKMKSVLPKNWEKFSILQKTSFREMKTLLEGYLLSSQGDRMTMANGVEGRYPFLDHRVVEHAISLPDRYKMPGFNQKYILKKAFSDLVPHAIVNRPKQPYQAPDIYPFIDADGKVKESVAGFLSKTEIENAGVFEYKMVEQFLEKIKSRRNAQYGYRDNMLFVFMLTTQMAIKQREPIYSTFDEAEFPIHQEPELSLTMRHS